MALIALFAAGASEVRKVTSKTAGFPHALIYFGLTALLVANLMMGVVSAQIFGDPWISTLLPFTFGLLLSGYRLQVEEKG